MENTWIHRVLESSGRNLWLKTAYVWVGEVVVLLLWGEVWRVFHYATWRSYIIGSALITQKWPVRWWVEYNYYFCQPVWKGWEGALPTSTISTSTSISRRRKGRGAIIDLEWIDLFIPESQKMETSVAGRNSRVRPPRPAFESNGFACSQSVTQTQQHQQSSSNGWVATSLIESSVWSSPPSPLMDLSTPVPRSRSIQVPHVRAHYIWEGFGWFLLNWVVWLKIGIEDFCQVYIYMYIKYLHMAVFMSMLPFFYCNLEDTYLMTWLDLTQLTFVYQRLCRI